MIGLLPDVVLNCFISSLILEIHNELDIQRPHSISHIVRLAKLIEARLKDAKPKSKKSPYLNNNNKTPNHTLNNHTLGQTFHLYLNLKHQPNLTLTQIVFLYTV